MPVHRILEYCLKGISYVLKQTLDILNRNKTDRPIGTIIGITYINNLYTTVLHNLGPKLLRSRLYTLHNRILSYSQFRTNFAVETLQ